MTTNGEPRLDPVKITDLRPTQMTVGYREVEGKCVRWKKMLPERREKFFGLHMIPVIQGPKKRLYILDHHHLVRAFYEMKVTDVLIDIRYDLSMIGSEDGFWSFLDRRCWTHPYDEDGRRCQFKDMPSSIAKLADDPYRSLAGELRRKGGFAKDATPFSEFLWADYLRSHIRRKTIAKDYDEALAAALELARGQDAVYLPGWCGPS